MAKYLGFTRKPVIKDGYASMVGSIYESCSRCCGGEVTVTIGTDTQYMFCLESDGDKYFDNEGFKAVLEEENVTYKHLVDNLFGIMQVVKCAIEGQHYREIMSYFTGEAGAVPCGLDEDILGKIKEDRKLIVQGCGCTATSKGKNFPEFDKLIEEMFCLNKAKL